MDPIAICGSALNVLNQIKEQLKECEAAFEAAAELNSMLEVFEVTIMMIPERAALDDDVQKGSSGVEEPEKSKTVGLEQSALSLLQNDDDDNDNVLMNPMLKKAGEEYGTELVGFAKDTAKDTVTGMIEESPLGLITELFQIGKDGTPIFNSGPSPAETMRGMKEKKVMGIRVHSDLEVMFTGMAFIISGGMRTIMEAVETLKKMDSMGHPNCLWIFMPWKVAATKALKEELDGHAQCLNKQTLALSNAIGVASYAVQLEQLENVLDATSDLKHLDMKQMWKRKLGTDKSIVSFSQFFEVLLNTLGDQLKVLRKAYQVDERVNRNRFSSEVALSRFTNQLFNENCDDNITVYEFASSLSELTRPGVDTLKLIAERLISEERKLYEHLKFTPLKITEDDERFKVTPSYDGYKEGKEPQPQAYRIEHGIVKLRPFHRVLLRAEFPEPDLEYFSYDKLVLLKHDKNPRDLLNKSLKKAVTFSLTTVKHTQCFLNVETNEQLISPFDRQWNAHKTFYDQSLEKFTPEGFTSYKNFETYVIDEHNKLGDEGRKSDASTVNSENHTSCGRILYVPYVLSPGYYSPRYCMDSYMDHEVNVKKLAQSSKSYYRGNLSEFTEKDVQKAVENRKAHRRGSVQSVQYTGLSAHEVRKESLGMIIECEDIFEIVYAQDENEDYEKSKWDYDSDEENDSDDDNDEDKKKKGAKKKQTNFRPLLSAEFPYLPERDAMYIDEPKLVYVYINAPPPKKKKKEKSGKEKPVEKDIKHSEEKEDVPFTESKYGIFFKSNGELIHEKAVWPINKHNPLHRIRLRDEAIELDMDDYKDKGYLEDGELKLRIGFLRSDGKLYDHVPYLDLIISSTHTFSDSDSDSDTSDSDSSKDSVGGWSDDFSLNLDDLDLGLEDNEEKSELSDQGKDDKSDQEGEKNDDNDQNDY